MRNKINNRHVLGAALLAALSGQAVAAKAPDLTELFDQFWSPTRLGPAECRAGVLSATLSAAPVSSMSFPKIEPSRNMKNQLAMKPVKPCM